MLGAMEDEEATRCRDEAAVEARNDDDAVVGREAKAVTVLVVVMVLEEVPWLL